MNITNYTSPVCSYVFSRCSQMNLIRCKTLIKKGRWHSSNADGVHVQSNRIGPWIEGCTFEGMTDDGMNFYTLGAYCYERLAPDRFKVAARGPIQKGDFLWAYNS